MNHREQMQKETEQWQKQSVRLIQGIRYGVLIFGILVVAVLFLRNLGFPKEINEHHTALIITEDGRQLECDLEIRGDITEYPLNKGKFGANDKLVIYVNGKRMVEVYCRQGGKYLFAQRRDTVCVLTVNRDALIMETNIQTIFPDMTDQRCLVYLGNDSFQLPGEYAQHFTLLQK